MKKLVFAFIVSFFFISDYANAQCKFGKIPNYYLQSVHSEDCSVSPDVSTKMEKLLDKIADVLCYSSFVKSGDDYYLLFSLTKKNSKNFETNSNNPLVFNFDSGEPVTIFPCGSFTPNKKGLRGSLECRLVCYYKITESQLQQVYDNGLLSSLRYYFSSDKEITSAQTEEGAMFFEYEVLSKSFKNNFSAAAACILSN